ncbi:hypothetical protein [Streptomyces lateritius]|uniref:hypothetical protein n=1 Tax=Streptomyces lateritius TaxID=67313 RepID=UPI001C8BFCEE|nr:hypothetical protein [Streptomyces lateritius]MBX9427062.1 hypothetical protein [Streptomyces lateritius]
MILADGTRTLTAAGRWNEALAHIEKHDGIGLRMLDGRQVAVLAALSSDPGYAADLLAQTTPGEPWENAITSCLTVMCHRAVRRPAHGLLSELADTYVQREPEIGITVFDTRLGLTVLDLCDQPDSHAAHLVAKQPNHQLRRRYAARECLMNTRFMALVSPEKERHKRDLLHACALESGELPTPSAVRLRRALRVSNRVIRRSVDRPQ